MQQKDTVFAKLLRDNGFRVTPGRVAILTTLAKEARPLTVGQVGEALKNKLDSVTLYRALEALQEKGIIRRVDLGHGHAHYELQQSHHHHLVCTDCGAIEDIESPMLEKAVLAVAKDTRRFKSIYSHNIEFFGSCVSCSK